jgi:hypothetical protein
VATQGLASVASVPPVRRLGTLARYSRNQVPAVPESGRVILGGLNELGYQTLEELRRLGEEVVVVARTPREGFAAAARALGVTLLEGSYRQERVLRSAGAQTANALVVTGDDDVGNVHAALVAHDLNPVCACGCACSTRSWATGCSCYSGDCQILDAAAMAVPAFVSAALHRDRQQRLRVDADGDAELFPAPGDELLCLAADDAPTRPTDWVGEARSHRRPSRTSTVASVQAVLAADRRLRIFAVVLAAFCLLSVLVFSRFQHLGLLDAVYFTVTIVTTTGPGPLSS